MLVICPHLLLKITSHAHVVEQVGFIALGTKECTPWGTVQQLGNRVLELVVGFGLIAGDFGESLKKLDFALNQILSGI